MTMTTTTTTLFSKTFWWEFQSRAWTMDNMTFQSLTFQGDFQSRAGQHDTSNRSSKFDFWIEGHFNQRLDNMTVATGLQSLTVASKYQPAPHTSLEYRYASKDHLVLVFPHCCHAGKLWQGSILIYLGSTGIGFGPVGSLELKPVIWNGDGVFSLVASLFFVLLNLTLCSRFDCLSLFDQVSQVCERLTGSNGWTWPIRIIQCSALWLSSHQPQWELMGHSALETLSQSLSWIPFFETVQSWMSFHADFVNVNVWHGGQTVPVQTKVQCHHDCWWWDEDLVSVRTVGCFTGIGGSATWRSPRSRLDHYSQGCNTASTSLVIDSR